MISRGRMVQLEVEHGRVNSYTSRGSADPDLCRPRCCHRCHPQWLKLIDISWMNGDNTPSPLFAVRSGPWPRFGPQWISAGSEPVPRSVLALIDFWLLLCHHCVVAVLSRKWTSCKPGVIWRGYVGFGRWNSRQWTFSCRRWICHCMLL